MDNTLIERLAREAGMRRVFDGWVNDRGASVESDVEPEHLARFASLVAEHAAQIADAEYAEAANRECVTHEPILRGQMSAAKAIGETIRAKFKEPT